MKTGIAHWCGIVMLAAIGCIPAFAADNPGPVKTEIKKSADGKYQLLRDGKPYFIKGGGGGGDKKTLADDGGNSCRTWGIGTDTQKELDDDQKLGLTVTLGIWLGHKDEGFNYSDPVAVKKQYDEAKRDVEKFKDSPALLMWAVGNEMENPDNDNQATWTAIEDLAKMVHQVDPNHPVMTVVAEIGGDKVQHIEKWCPDLDVVGINSYGGGATVVDRYLKNGGTKPVVITEFGPAGTWEIPKNAFGAVTEETSTRKAKDYRNTYEKSVLAHPGLVLGSYAFTWGYKIEATATWYGMFLPDGSKLAAVDTMQELWSGKKPEHPCPEISKLTVDKDQVKGKDTIHASVQASDPKGDPIKIEWSFYQEQANYGVQGTGADATPSYPDAIEKNGEKTVTIHVPKFGGVYRLYCYVRNNHHGAAVGSLPVKVEGPIAPFKAPEAALPFVILGDGQKGTPYIPSGYMGDHASISIDQASTVQPRKGHKTCTQIDFTNKANWGGVVWQSPANDWGDKPGGYDLTGAMKLTFWARGEKGGEKVKFGYGLIGIDKRYHDSSKADMEVELTKDWKQYTIDVSQKDMSCIKSGFWWTLAGQGAPVTFYLDDIEYQ